MQNHLNYPEILNESMKYLVREILTRVEKHGFYGDHYLYITFDTKSKNVILSERVKKLYPTEITIVLQYQYDNLKVYKDKFSVELSFNGTRELITIPFNSIITLVDPMANFSIALKSTDSSGSNSSLEDEFLSMLQKDYEESFYFPSLNDKKKISKTTSEIKTSKDKKDSKNKTISKKDNVISMEDYKKKIADKNNDKDKKNND